MQGKMMKRYGSRLTPKEVLQDEVAQLVRTGRWMAVGALIGYLVLALAEAW